MIKESLDHEFSSGQFGGLAARFYSGLNLLERLALSENDTIFTDERTQARFGTAMFGIPCAKGRAAMNKAIVAHSWWESLSRPWQTATSERPESNSQVGMLSKIIGNCGNLPSL